MSLRPMVDALVGGFHDASKSTECDELATWCDEMARNYATSEKMGNRYRRIADLLRVQESLLVEVRDCTDIAGWGSTVAASDLFDRIHDITAAIAKASQ